MKKITNLILTVLLSATLLFTACTGGENSSSPSSSNPNFSSDAPANNVEITCVLTNFEIEDIYLSEYDFTACFEITVNGESVEVKEEYLDLSALKAQAGTYSVYCSYPGAVTAEAVVNVVSNEYVINLAQSEISVMQAYALTYDYLSLFSATVNGKTVAIEESMVETNLSNVPGTYYYTVKLANQSKTLTVNVTNEHQILVDVSYDNYSISVSDLSKFDYTALFSVFVDGVATQVTADMIDRAQLEGANVGDEIEVYLNFTKDATTVREVAKITVVEDEQLVINAKNVQTYPNSGAIDLTTLFTISRGDEKIEVTSDMISGSIDYSKAGENIITLTYNGVTATATVEVVIGVVINYRSADTVVIKKGTNKATYPFEKDFILIINGVRFTVIADYINVDNVDFSTAGTYVATLTVPYNENKFGLTGGVKFDYYEKNITYVVVENDYKLSVKQESVSLPKGTTSYNPFKNVTLSINGINQSLTSIPEYVDRITCYAEVVSDPIDFTSANEQQVIIDVYVNGINNQPVRVSFTVIIETSVKVSATNAVIFSGETLMATTLFTATEEGENREVTFDMISGKIDTFNPGVYYVTANFKGVKATAKVVVLSNLMKGEYKTNLYAISRTNSDYDENYGDTTPSKTRVGAMRITQDGKIFIKNVEATLVDAIDEKTLVINYRSNIHTVYYDNGIIAIVPENAIKLQYYEEKRPYIYFNTDIWTISGKYIINSLDSYVLDSTLVGYSFDVFKLTNKITGEQITYALKVNLVSRMNSDTIYVVSWGEGFFKEGFTGAKGEYSSFTFDGETYDFVMQTVETGKVPKADDQDRPYAGMTFKGTINGESATLSANGYQAFTLTVGNQKILSANYYEIQEMKNGGVNAYANEVFLYEGDKRNNLFYSYKFIVDTKSKTFEFVERDNLLGYYEIENGYIFLDGYGTGFINFNAKSYYETCFTYSKLGNVITVKYLNTLPDFEYGNGAQFILDAFGNTLTVHSGKGLTVGQVYENTFIQSGIIVKVNIETIGSAADSVAKAELYRAIEIITANGKLSADANGVGSYIDTTRVRWGVPGFYRLAIKADLYGEEVTAYYAIQVLESVYSDNPVVANYGAGVIYPENGLTIDEYGRVMLTVGSNLYNGSLKLGENNAFTAELYGVGGVVNLEGTLVEKGLIQIRASGAVGYLDYYCVGTSYIAGKDNVVLRAFKLSDKTVFMLASAETLATGERVTVESVNGKEILSIGAVLKISGANKVIYAKTLDWANAKKGLELSDGYLGTYAGANQTLKLDGFGVATYGEEKGTYVINGSNKITVYINDTPCAYAVNPETGEYSVMDIAFDHTLVEGRTYTAEYNFICDNYLYSATTSFTFLANGKVKIVSTSFEHDSGEEKCMIDSYSPAFCPGGEFVGTYGVKGTKVTVSANGYTFVFNVINVVYPNDLICLTTNVLSDAHGYFSAGTVFSKNY